MKLEVVTPIGAKVTADVSQVTAPGTLGDLGILPGHRPLITSLGIGLFNYTEGGARKWLAINGGYLEVADDHVIVATETAETPSEVDVDRAKAALQRAEERIKELAAEEGVAERRSLAQASKKRAQVRIEVAKHVKSAPPPA